MFLINYKSNGLVNPIINIISPTHYTPYDYTINLKISLLNLNLIL